MRHIKKHGFFILFGLTTNFLLFVNPAWSAVREGGRTNETTFQNYLRERCQNDSRFISTSETFLFCDNVFQGDFAQQLDSRNTLGIQPSGDGGAHGGLKGRPGQATVGGGTGWGWGGAVSAGNEDIGLGFLITSLSADTERNGTELENGFEAELSGHVLGIDYQLLDSLIVGATFGSVEDKADVAGDGGKLKTDSSSQTIYATWVPAGNLSLDFYYGTIDSDIDSQRNFSFESDFYSVEGLIRGSYNAEQTINGFSINYDWYPGAWLFGLFAGIDSVETETEGYSEQGTTGFELRYPDQKIESATQSLGLRIGFNAEFGWGVLLPSLKMMSVSEDKNDARAIPISMAIAPDDVDPFVAQTDAPDRDYTVGSFGIVAAFKNGSQLFLDYEKRSGHDFIDSSSLTAGALFAF
jgi:hypothetical protein